MKTITVRERPAGWRKQARKLRRVVSESRAQREKDEARADQLEQCARDIEDSLREEDRQTWSDREQVPA